ncbi:MAG: hypothetical protein V8Q30_08675 [Acutalibacteraceae bacterium]
MFTVDVTGQGKLNLKWNTDFDKEFAAMYDYANIDFVTFEGALPSTRPVLCTSTLTRMPSSTK